MVVDRFHAVGLANRAVDDVRRRVQNETLGHRGRAGDPLYGIRRLLLRGYERLSVRQLDRISAGLVGDRYGEVGAAWMAEELCRAIYTATDLAHARRRLIVFYDFVSHAEVPELVRLARTISTWETEILAFHTTGGLSNGPTEGINLLIKKIKRVSGHGFPNFDNYRLRLLLHAARSRSSRCGTTWAAKSGSTADVNGGRTTIRTWPRQFGSRAHRLVASRHYLASRLGRTAARLLGCRS